MPSEQTTPSRAELIAEYERRVAAHTQTAEHFRSLDNPALLPGAVTHERLAAEYRFVADALRDAERLDWLETNREYAIGHPTKTDPTWHLFFNDDARDVSAPTLRAAIDAATLADGGTDQ